MRSLSYIVISQFHRKCSPFLKGVLNNRIIVFQSQDNFLWHVRKFGDHLLALRVDIVINFDFTTWLGRQEIVDFVAVYHINWHLKVKSIDVRYVWVRPICIVILVKKSLMHLESVWCIYWKNRIGFCTEIFDDTTLIIIRFKGVLWDS